MEIIYFELNNWFCGRDYPNSESFIGWVDREIVTFYNLKYRFYNSKRKRKNE